MKTAQEVVDTHDSFSKSNWSESQALLQELQTIDSAITNIPMAPQVELKSRHIESSNNMQQQVIVTDSTGATNSLIESVKPDLKKSHKFYSQSVNEVLDKQLSAKERARTVDLETMTSDINDYSNKLQDPVIRQSLEREGKSQIILESVRMLTKKEVSCYQVIKKVMKIDTYNTLGYLPLCL